MKLEEKLVSLRKEKGLSQMRLAEMMNVSRQAISRWEVGNSVPSIDNLKFLGNLYDVPLEYLLHDNAPEPNRREEILVQEKTQGEQKKNKAKIFVPFIVALVGALIALSMMLLMEQHRKPVSMRDMSGSEVIITGKDDFDVNW